MRVKRALISMPANLSVRVCRKSNGPKTRKALVRELAKAGYRRLLVVVFHVTRSLRFLAVGERGPQFFTIASSAPQIVGDTFGEVCFLAIKAAYIHCPCVAMVAADGGRSWIEIGRVCGCELIMGVCVCWARHLYAWMSSVVWECRDLHRVGE
jgi:hypothetical protein